MDHHDRGPLFQRADEYGDSDGEVGEVARIMARRFGEQSFKASEAAADLPDEIADVLFVLICLANQTGVDLTDALARNLQKKSARDADRHRNNEKLG